MTRLWRLTGPRSDGWAETPDDVDMPSTWRLATVPERVWRFLTKPRFSWLMFIAIQVIVVLVRAVIA